MSSDPEYKFSENQFSQSSKGSGHPLYDQNKSMIKKLMGTGQGKMMLLMIVLSVGMPLLGKCIDLVIALVAPKNQTLTPAAPASSGQPKIAAKSAKESKIEVEKLEKKSNDSSQSQSLMRSQEIKMIEVTRHDLKKVHKLVNEQDDKISLLSEQIKKVGLGVDGLSEQIKALRVHQEAEKQKKEMDQSEKNRKEMFRHVELLLPYLQYTNAYYVQSMVTHRAWLRPKHDSGAHTQSVTYGTPINARLGSVKYIDVDKGVVVTTRGFWIGYAPQDL